MRIAWSGIVALLVEVLFGLAVLKWSEMSDQVFYPIFGILLVITVVLMVVGIIDWWRSSPRIRENLGFDLIPDADVQFKVSYDAEAVAFLRVKNLGKTRLKGVTGTLREIRMIHEERGNPEFDAEIEALERGAMANRFNHNWRLRWRGSDKAAISIDTDAILEVAGVRTNRAMGNARVFPIAGVEAPHFFQGEQQVEIEVATANAGWKTRQFILSLSRSNPPRIRLIQLNLEHSRLNASRETPRTNENPSIDLLEEPYDHVLWKEQLSPTYREHLNVSGPLCPTDKTPLFIDDRSGALKDAAKESDVDVLGRTHQADWIEKGTAHLLCPSCKKKYFLGMKGKHVRDSRREVNAIIQGKKLTNRQ